MEGEGLGDLVACMTSGRHEGASFRSSSPQQDSHGRLCVVCPWHKHTITLDTGESLYTAIDPANPRKRRYNCSKGVKQVCVCVSAKVDSHLLDPNQTLLSPYTCCTVILIFLGVCN